jgi:hypothetical protein
LFISRSKLPSDFNQASSYAWQLDDLHVFVCGMNSIYHGATTTFWLTLNLFTFLLRSFFAAMRCLHTFCTSRPDYKLGMYQCTP